MNLLKAITSAGSEGKNITEYKRGTECIHSLFVQHSISKWHFNIIYIHCTYKTVHEMGSSANSPNVATARTNRNHEAQQKTAKCGSAAKEMQAVVNRDGKAVDGRALLRAQEAHHVPNL